MPEMDGIKLVQEKSAQTTKDTFEVDDKAVQSIRNEIPLGVSGQPIMRIPKNQKLMPLLQSGIYIKRIASEDRCIRLVALPLQGGATGEFHCSRSCISAGPDGGKYCPEHDAEVFGPKQSHPVMLGRTFNSASIQLTDAEKTVAYEKDGRKVIAQMEDGADISARYNAVAPVQAASEKVRAPKVKRARAGSRNTADTIRIEITLADLEDHELDKILYGVTRAMIAAMDMLPAKTIADMKRIVALQEKLKLGYAK